MLDTFGEGTNYITVHGEYLLFQTYNYILGRVLTSRAIVE